jgi:hypothetical protein
MGLEDVGAGLALKEMRARERQKNHEVAGIRPPVHPADQDDPKPVPVPVDGRRRGARQAAAAAAAAAAAPAQRLTRFVGPIDPEAPAPAKLHYKRRDVADRKDGFNVRSINLPQTMLPKDDEARSPAEFARYAEHPPSVQPMTYTVPARARNVEPQPPRVPKVSHKAAADIEKARAAAQRKHK